MTTKIVTMRRRRVTRARPKRWQRSQPLTRLIWTGGNVLPMIFETQMEYVESWPETTAGGFVDWVWRGNSIYDPYNGAGGNSYPAGYAAMLGLYEKYKVLASSITLEFINSDSDDPVRLVTVPSTDGAAYVVAGAEYVEANPYSKAITSSAAKGGAITPVNKHFTRELFGVKDLDADAFGAATTTNPASVWYWHAVIWNQSTNALAGVARVRIHYWVEFSQLKKLAEI